MAEWVPCPHCGGDAREPNTGKKRGSGFIWCTFCLPTRHVSNLGVPPKAFNLKWHEVRGQRPGSVPTHKEVTYALDPRRS